MAKRTKFVLNRAGVRELLQSQEMATICTEAAQKVAANASHDGLEYEVSTMVGKNRVNARVSPGSIHAYFSNLKHNTLLKALGGG